MMMKEIALHVLDIAQNSISAGAKLVEIEVCVKTDVDFMSVSIRDDGCGMDEELRISVENPFTTSRTTRKVGLGIPFFKVGAQMCNGSFKLDSEPGVGTYVCATYQLSHIDRAPLGDMAETMLALIVCNENINFVYRYCMNDKVFELDTRDIKLALGSEVPLSTPEVIAWIRDSLKEGIEEINTENIGGVLI